MKIAIPVAIAVVLGLGAWFMFSGDEKESSPVVAGEQAKPEPKKKPEPPKPPAEDVVAPVSDEPTVPPGFIAPSEDLDDSDSSFANTIADLSPRLAGMLISDEQIRRWVVAVDAMAGGELPVKNRPITYEMDPFAVKKGAKKVVIDPANYRRYDALVNTVTSIEADRAVKYYELWSQRFEEAYDELGKTGSFDQQLKTLIANTLAVEEAPGLDTEIKRPHVFWIYADDEQESESEVTKFIWRMGPANQAKIQAYLRGIQGRL